MTTLVHAALVVRKTARASIGYTAAALFGLLVWLGLFRAQRWEFGTEHGMVIVAWLGVVLSRLVGRTRAHRRAQSESWLDLELSLLMLVGCHAIVQLLGGLRGPFYPLVYVLVALTTSLADRVVARIFLPIAVGFEAVLYFATERQQDPQVFITHVLFTLTFALLSSLFTQAEIARVRNQSRRALDEAKQKVHEEARMFRLVGSSTVGAPRDDERLFRSSLDQVHASLYYLLDLLKRTLDLHSCVLLIKDAAGEQLRIAELATDSDDVAEGPFPNGTGAVGAAAERGLLTNLEHIKPGYAGICYYRGPARVRAFLAVPVREQDRLIGALCADRLEDKMFTAREEQILSDAVAHIVRALENERVFVQLERSKREQTTLHQASQALSAALDEKAVSDATFQACAEVAPYDFAAVTAYDSHVNRHSVRHAVGDGAESLANLSFRDNASLTAMAVKNRHYLPYRGEFDDAQQVVYTRKVNVRGMQSLLILPLIVREEAIGTLALAARRPDAFSDSVRPTLQLLANQLAVALSNAASVKRLEELATTDGLTGCFNKRAFTEELDRRMRSATRFGRKLSLIITDIDHFKSVNDTYGHATGDVVIRELGEILRRLKRETDMVARFGGEEFCVLCEETDTEGAVQLAERVRDELKNTVFQTEIGKLRVTCSVGVATYPVHAKDQRVLFEMADKALYAAKHAGRDQVRAVGE